MTASARNPATAALIGGLLLLPFLAANAIVANRIEPFFSLIRPGPHTSTFEYVLLAIVLLCIPLGAFIAARPLSAKARRTDPRVLLVNGGLSALMLTAFVVLTFALGSDIYRCDVLGIPNCD
jgi:hypothetical protein